jgi:mono/diheme cytochrome c family protein
MQMKSPKSVAGILVVGVAVAVAVVEYGSAAAVTQGPQSRAVATVAKKTQKKKETKAQKLAKALKACKKNKSKAKRKACETAAKKKYKTHTPPPHEEHTTTTTGTTGTTTATTGTTTATTTTTGTGTTTTGTGTTTTGTGTTTTGTGTTTTGTGGNVAEELAKAKTATETPTSGMVLQGKTAYLADTCQGCHGMNGEGGDGDGDIPFASLTRAQTVTGVIEQLIEPVGGMPNFDKEIPYEQKELLGDYVCVVFSKKCEEAH